MKNEIIAVESRKEVKVFWNSCGEVSIMISGDLEVDPEALSLPVYAVAAVARALLVLVEGSEKASA